MSASFDEQAAALRACKEAGDIAVVEYATALAELRRMQSCRPQRKSIQEAAAVEVGSAAASGEDDDDNDDDDRFLVDESGDVYRPSNGGHSSAGDTFVTESPMEWHVPPDTLPPRALARGHGDMETGLKGS